MRLRHHVVDVDIVRYARAPLSDAQVVRAVRAAQRAGGRRGSVDVSFVGTQRMRKTNRITHGEDTATDVLAFPDGGDAVSLGELVICPQIAKRSAQRAGEPWPREIIRLLVHGTLHLCGYDHAEPTDAARMFQLQERLVRSVAP
ncbi:MAG: rRNA maturation RNase YbeY [bacterium]|nr:rRNA maturation RNase YbeY [bacterium]